MIVFRSVFVPLKAAFMNLLSIGAAYGAIIAVFQWGWAKGLFGLEDTVPVNPFIPLMMFAILFGLSMDYEVFLLSRVREEFQKTGDSHSSVVEGLGATARVITSAALIMISVFGAFIWTDDVLVKMFGLGLAVAVLIDATIVRMVLVPATMALLGNANWWLPKWLDRILPHLDLEGASAPVSTQDEDGEEVHDRSLTHATPQPRTGGWPPGHPPVARVASSVPTRGPRSVVSGATERQQRAHGSWPACAPMTSPPSTSSPSAPGRVASAPPWRPPSSATGPRSSTAGRRSVASP